MFVTAVFFSLYLTIRRYVAVRLFGNRSRAKSKKVADEAIAEFVTDVLITFFTSVTEQTHCNMESICFRLLQKSSFY